MVTRAVLRPGGRPLSRGGVSLTAARHGLPERALFPVRPQMAIDLAAAHRGLLAQEEPFAEPQPELPTPDCKRWTGRPLPLLARAARSRNARLQPRPTMAGMRLRRPLAKPGQHRRPGG